MPRKTPKENEIEKWENGLPWLFQARAGEWIEGNGAYPKQIRLMTEEHIKNAISLVKTSGPIFENRDCKYKTTQEHYEKVANEKIRQLEGELFFRINGYNKP
ncbi:hypothetical protein HUE56_24125 (plasmid) [Azospirillum oryzae]|uniref:Uncharacterized protein n=1 Tax=Azospirillum oryzae TaxID=286727 RepID=A0A6N1APF6_9PROT|nr:hypothetical protein [Azospirillum oryzae]KAA0586351.1 hypothetical protein FZ938_21995 [Azospirillum oryzae]QKS53586.1 hypothetical protein HUE56_24125 [Azospirillum oryzae]GLR81507.1 hypothetical protein GCM10007856_41950 [Azospirillum oryzae]